jgi:hypothetical protein
VAKVAGRSIGCGAVIVSAKKLDFRFHLVSFSPKRKGSIFVSAKSISIYIIVLTFDNRLFICSSIDYR